VIGELRRRFNGLDAKPCAGGRHERVAHVGERSLEVGVIDPWIEGAADPR
jgi:hypothetical protein